MKKLIILSFIIVLFFSCAKKDNQDVVIPEPTEKVANSTEINLGIGIKNDANLDSVFKTLNDLNFDIRQMAGFVYNSNTPPTGINNLINFLNQKPYINTGVWKATTGNVYFFAPENKTRIITGYFEMDSANQTDLLGLIDSMNLEDKQGVSKYILLSVPEGAHTYWKNQMLTYPFVRWTETYDKTCISYDHVNVSSANVPATGNLNQVIPIPLSFMVLNGCGGFGNFNETTSGNTKTISVIAKYAGCFCTQAIKVVNATYNFVPTTTGIHEIKFLQPNGSFLTYQIEVQ